MHRIKSVGVLSSAKISAVILGCLGVVVIPFILIGRFGMKFDEKLFFLLAPLLYAGMGFIYGAIGAFVYNLAARWVGGIEIQLESPLATAANQIGVMWPAPGPK
jgi:hypothetical protein